MATAMNEITIFAGHKQIVHLFFLVAGSHSETVPPPPSAGKVDPVNKGDGNETWDRLL